MRSVLLFLLSIFSWIPTNRALVTLAPELQTTGLDDGFANLPSIEVTTEVLDGGQYKGVTLTTPEIAEDDVEVSTAKLTIIYTTPENNEPDTKDPESITTEASSIEEVVEEVTTRKPKRNLRKANRLLKRENKSLTRKIETLKRDLKKSGLERERVSNNFLSCQARTKKIRLKLTASNESLKKNRELVTQLEDEATILFVAPLRLGNESAEVFR